MRARTRPVGLAETQSLFDLTDGPRPMIHGVDGHRARMRTRLLTAGPDALADHEMLEMLLFLALPRRDTKPVARLLLDRFGSFEAAISAAPAQLLAVDGVGEAGAAALKLVQGASLRLLRDTVRAQPILKDWNRLLDYLIAALAHEHVEQARVLFLDSKNRLLADEIQGRGTVNQTMVAGVERHGDCAGAQPPQRRSGRLAGGYGDDQERPARGGGAGDRAAGPYYYRGYAMGQFSAGRLVVGGPTGQPCP
jgi:hypothetical protein